ncbi:MAG: serine/threonine-protein kinase, partial [Gemmataceae bacterium]
MPDPRLDDLISLYLRLRAAGSPADPADVAHGCPELLPELRRHLDALDQFRDPARSASTTLPQAPPAGPAPPSPPGYELLGMLGQGGMGVVYKARQVGLNRLVALKMIVSGPYASPDLLARFQGEM